MYSHIPYVNNVTIHVSDLPHSKVLYIYFCYTFEALVYTNYCTVVIESILLLLILYHRVIFGGKS